jgi:hypothetical protein
VDDLLDSADVALMLGTSRGRVSEMLKANPGRYSAWKERGTGGRYKPSFRERWRVPRSSVELLRADLAKN